MTATTVSWEMTTLTGIHASPDCADIPASIQLQGDIYCNIRNCKPNKTSRYLEIPGFGGDNTQKVFVFDDVTDVGEVERIYLTMTSAEPRQYCTVKSIKLVNQNRPEEEYEFVPRREYVPSGDMGYIEPFRRTITGKYVICSSYCQTQHVLS